MLNIWKWSAAGLACVALSAWAQMQEGAVPRRTAPLKAVTAPKNWVLKRDNQNYRAGPYIAFASDWSVSTGKLNLRMGTDYADHMIIKPGDFPRNTVMSWQWPDQAPRSGVYGYLHIAYGYYAGGVPLKPVRPVRVADVGAVETDFAVEIQGDPDRYNLLSETFLTDVPNNFKARNAELGFLASVSGPGQRFFDSSRQLGTWTDPGGRSWKVAVNKEYYMFVPVAGRVTRGTLYFGAALKWMKAQGQLTGNEWLNGLAIGIEPVGGDGRMTVKNWVIRGL